MSIIGQSLYALGQATGMVAEATLGRYVKTELNKQPLLSA
jgi:hypothetical protein